MSAEQDLSSRIEHVSNETVVSGTWFAYSEEKQEETGYIGRLLTSPVKYGPLTHMDAYEVKTTWEVDLHTIAQYTDYNAGQLQSVIQGPKYLRERVGINASVNPIPSEGDSPERFELRFTFATGNTPQSQ